MVPKPGSGSFGTVCRCHVLLKNWISISIRLTWNGPKETQWTKTSRWHGTPNHHWLWKLYLTSSWVDSVPLLSSFQTVGPWLLKDMKNVLSREHDFGPVALQSFLSLVQVRRFWRWQEWLDTKNATTETHVTHTSVRDGSWSTNSSCSPLFVNPPTFLNAFCFTKPHQGAVIPIAYTFFLPHFFPFLLMCLETELREQPVFF